MPKRFTEADAQRIFALAAERQHESGQDETGLTLEELEEVGRAAGLDPAFVREAAMDALRPETTGTTRRILGMPLEIRRERFIRGTVTDEAWAQAVVEMRRQFNKPGLVTDIGPLREWRSDVGENKQPVTVTLTPERGGTRIVVEQSQTQAMLGLGIATGVNALMGVIFALLALTGVESDMFVPAIIMLVIAAVMGGGTYGGMRGYSRSQSRKFEAVLDKIDLAARNAREPEAPERTGQIDPALLDDPTDLGLEAGTSGRRRDRA